MITSVQNEQVKYVVSLQHRKGRLKNKEFIIEGWKFVQEALQRGADIKKIYICPERTPQEWQFLIGEITRAEIPILEVDDRVLRKMSATEEPQGILGIVRQAQFTWQDVRLTCKDALLILDGLQDPGNLGTILRTALAAGVRQVCLTRGTVDVYSPKVLRSTMGTIFSLIILSEQDPEEIMAYCSAHAVPLLVADVEGEVYSARKLELPLALVIGNEGNGPSELFKRHAGRSLTIPMCSNVESLNAAMAAGILLYEIARQRDFL